MDFYYKDKIISSDNLDEIESQEDDDGQIRRRFVFKGEENGQIFVEPRKSPPSKFCGADGKIDRASLKAALDELVKYAALLEKSGPKSFEDFKKENKIKYEDYGYDYDFKRKY